MGSFELLFICASAFAAVFLLLTVLAVIMRLILVIFPYKEPSSDAAVLAAMASVVTSLFPGTKITKVEEIK
ncbi:MAG: hypothetical protein ABIE70_08445 [bacterium]